MIGSPFLAVAALRQSASPTLIDCLRVEDFRKRYGQDRLISSVHDLDAPALPLLAFLVTFHNHGAGLGERVVSGGFEAGVRLPFRVLNHLVLGPEIEVVQRRFSLVLGRKVRLVGGMLGARGTALIIPPSEVVTLAWVLGALLMLHYSIVTGLFDDGQTSR
jgi:hypothetical protein